MSGGNRLGPSNLGPMTGRGLGLCAGYNAPGFMNPREGRGLGRGIGFGRGLGFRRRDIDLSVNTYQEPMGYQEPVEYSKAEKIKILKAEKAEIDKELKELM